MSVAFARAKAMMAAIAALLSQGLSNQTVFERVGAYKSRGKGLGKFSGKSFRRGGYVGDKSGNREAQRHAKQGLQNVVVKGFSLIQSVKS
ncbi:hypothetical protein ACO0K3_03865 [Undibacterium sp. Rencai35W]|uniref:hypothetical protein n=1 Tax=Undibacterium sp. Rencai35W TaxID=3413046 RepID=UPI003BF13932